MNASSTTMPAGGPHGSPAARPDDRSALHWLLRLRAWLTVVNGIGAALSAAAIVFACLAITWAVLGRGFVGMNTVWELEASVYLLIYAAFLSAAYTHCNGGQIAIEVLRNAIKGRSRRIHRALLDAVALILFALLFVSGWEMFATAWTSGWRSETLWGPPLWIPYLAIPVGAGLMVPTLLVDILLRLAGQDLPEDETSGGH